MLIRYLVLWWNVWKLAQLHIYTFLEMKTLNIYIGLFVCIDKLRFLCLFLWIVLLTDTFFLNMCIYCLSFLNKLIWFMCSILFLCRSRYARVYFHVTCAIPDEGRGDIPLVVFIMWWLNSCFNCQLWTEKRKMVIHIHTYVMLCAKKYNLVMISIQSLISWWRSRGC
jgi:hypothetical protein